MNEKSQRTDDRQTWTFLAIIAVGVLGALGVGLKFQGNKHEDDTRVAVAIERLADKYAPVERAASVACTYSGVVTSTGSRP